MPKHPDDGVILLAIQYMYGIGISEVMADDVCDFHWFPKLAATAERYEITGLAEFSFEIACRIFDDRLDDPVELEEFLETLDVHGEICHPDPSHAKFTLRFMTENLMKLRNKPVCRELCSRVPTTAVSVVNFVANNPRLAVQFVKFVAETKMDMEKSK
jgi:hypothetical protein